MNVWIFQDQVGSNMRAKLAEEGGNAWTWNVDRYVRDTAEPHIQPGDRVLQWQPQFDLDHPAGIYAYGRVVQGPHHVPNEKSNWQVEVQITDVLGEPITRDAIWDTRNLVLRSMLIMRMPGGHIVFPVTPEQWAVLQEWQTLRPSDTGEAK